MEYLHFDYKMEITYSNPASRCHFTIKGIPKENKRQKLVGMDISLMPRVDYSHGEDSYGNKQIHGVVLSKHSGFVYCVSGYIEIIQTEYEEDVDIDKLGIFKFPYGKCKPGEGLLAYYSSLDFSKCSTDYEKCIYVMHRLHQDFKYVPRSTEVYTGAEEAWKLGMGVCQDYAHIYITLLRLAGIPARYVCGLIIGEGASHAWVEAVCGDKWIGFDPTNDCLVLDNHIKFGHGRDATECAINRGIMWGGGKQAQKISVNVEKVVV